jgi:hypothetical protein
VACPRAVSCIMRHTWCLWNDGQFAPQGAKPDRGDVHSSCTSMEIAHDCGSPANVPVNKHTTRLFDLDHAKQRHRETRLQRGKASCCSLLHEPTEAGPSPCPPQFGRTHRPSPRIAGRTRPLASRGSVLPTAASVRARSLAHTLQHERKVGSISQLNIAELEHPMLGPPRFWVRCALSHVLHERFRMSYQRRPQTGGSSGLRRPYSTRRSTEVM